MSTASRGSTGLAEERDARTFLELLRRPGDLVEIRIPKQGTVAYTRSGYFDDVAAAADEIRKFDGQANIYATLNPCAPELLARSPNRLGRAISTTADVDILRREWLFFDIDATRPSGVSCTEEELAAAEEVATALWQRLQDAGWPEGVRGMSGNGYYVLNRLDLPNDREISSLLRRVLRGLAAECDTDRAHIDQTVYNAARILCVLGTRKVKGEPQDDRPHRRSALLYVPDDLACVTREQLESLAAAPITLLPKAPPNASEPLAEILRRHGVAFQEQPADANGIVWYHVAQCPFHDDGRRFECGVGQAPDGHYCGHCFHPEGEDKGWQNWKAALGLSTRGAADDFHRTDAGNGELFAQMYGDRLRFDHRRRHWLVWEGHHWTEDRDGEVRRLAKLAARHRYVSAPAIEDLQSRAAAAKFAIQSENRQRLEAMIVQGQSEPPIADAGESWNADPWLLGVGNGAVDLHTGLLRPGAPADGITLHVPVAFDPTAQCPRWLRFLNEVFRGDEALIEFIHRAVGYSLTGITTEQCLFLCWGKGSNGKSVMLTILRAVAGEYAYNAPFSLLEKQNRSAIPNDVAALVGRRLVSSSETNEGTWLNEARVKALTGCDPMTARFLHGEFFTFDPVAKYWLAVNHKPKVGDDSHGFWRRVRLIPFTRQFDEGKDADDGLVATLLAELPGIVAWAVRGALEWQAHGLPAPAAVLVATERYRVESDPLAQFIDEACVIGEGFSVGAAPAFKAYKSWAAEQGMNDRDMLGSTAFGTKMSGKFEKRHERRGNVYDGIGLVSEHDDPADVKALVKAFESSDAEDDVFAQENSLTRENSENAFTTLHPSPCDANEEMGKCRQCQRPAGGRTEFGTPVCGMHAAPQQQQERKFGHAL